MIHPLINENPHVQNIELGAGCSEFGYLYFSDCFMSDKKDIHILNTQCPVCHVTINCDANSIPSPENRFENIIMCNPYRYGFRDKDYAVVLLRELDRVAKNNCKIHILSHDRNPYATPSRVKSRVDLYNQEKGNIAFVFEQEVIDAPIKYPNCIFYNTDASSITSPNFKMTLTCRK